MSGHSKFANIKHKKEKNDAAKGKVFTRIGREIAVAVKEGGADPANNSKLRDVVAKAKANNMPNDTIDRSIKKAAGDANAANYESITYEGYGPSGTAIIVETLTDNRNRTASNVRNAFTKGSGNVGTNGCVSFMFDRKGQIIVDKEEYEGDADELMMTALDAGAEDFSEEEDCYEIYTDPDNFSEVREALEKAGEKLGYPLKAETNGSGGAKNILTKKEIEECDGIIIAADKNVEMARFDGKHVIKTSVSNGINKPEELIKKIVDGKASIYHAEGDELEATDDDEKEGFGHKVYKHLMNGVSHMLPFVVGGGVLIALGFLIDTIAGNADVGGTFGFTSPIASAVFWIGKAAFALMLPILAGFIAQSIADRPGLLPGIVGGVFAANGYTFQAFMENKDLVGDGSAVSGFLGALLAGFVAGLLVNLLKKAFSWMPKSMDGIKPVFIYPLLGTLLMGIFMCLVNPVVGAINTGVSNFLSTLGETSKLLLSIVLAAMMAIDMGGPFNKAAYVFGTAAIADGNTWIMAAVMIGGMVPPIAIALSTTFNKKKWTKEELKSGPVNYLMGLCFITEGAIPYAASDPLRVIPSCMVGSAVAGALTSLFNVTCPAPHGGIFTFIVCDHPLLYIVALAVGSVAGAFMFSILKKNVNSAVKSK